MNEEEKIAFNFYKGCNENDLKRFDDFSEVTKKQIKYTETLLHLIEKQQKEIEELKHDNSILCEIAYTGKRIQMPYTTVYTGTDNFISKDKIKEKIEELKNRKIGASTGIFAVQVDILEELLRG